MHWVLIISTLPGRPRGAGAYLHLFTAHCLMVYLGGVAGNLMTLFAQGLCPALDAGT